MSLRSCCCLQSIGKDALGHPGVARVPDETRDAAALHGRDLALLVFAQLTTGTFQFDVKGLPELFMPEPPVRHAQAIAEAVQAQSVDAFDDAFRVAQVITVPAVDVRAGLDPARELLFTGALEIPQARRAERLAPMNTYGHRACTRETETAGDNRHSLNHRNHLPSASARHTPARNQPISPIATYSSTSIRTATAP